MPLGGIFLWSFSIWVVQCPCTFERVLLGIFANLIHECVEIYMDDFSIYGDSFSKALHNLEKVLIRCRESNVSLIHKKCKIMSPHGIFIGHHISSSRIKVDPTNIKVIMEFPAPHSPKEVRIFLGHVGYYRRFIEKFSNIVAPIYKLLAKDTAFLWDSQCQITFEILKENLSTTLVMGGPDWTLLFHICIDASDTALGVFLGQKNDQLSYAIYYSSKKLSPTEFNYTITEK
jgi:hypothetical protein